MGTDKALVTVDGVAMGRRAADALAAAGLDPVVAVGGDAGVHAELGLDAIADRTPGAGPLGAIVTALDGLGCDVMVVACDMPWLDGARLVSVVSTRRTAPSLDAVVALSARGPEPLAGLYRTSGAGALAACFDDGERSPMRALAALRWAGVGGGASRWLTSVNTPEELREARGEGS